MTVKLAEVVSSIAHQKFEAESVAVEKWLAEQGRNPDEHTLAVYSLGSPFVTGYAIIPNEEASMTVPWEEARLKHSTFKTEMSLVAS